MEPTVHRDELFIGGRWIGAAARRRRSVTDSNTGEILGSYPLAEVPDLDAAVAAAEASLRDRSGWGGYPGMQRAAVMRRFADAIERRRAPLGELISREVGTPIARSIYSNVDTAVELLRFYASVIERTPIEDLRGAERGFSIVRREAVGVVGMIGPWNFPLSTLFFKLAPALAAGCTAIVKPASDTALDSYLIAEAAIEADLPPGVLNILPCAHETASRLVAHPGVKMIAFTGSTPVGRELSTVCGGLLKPVTLGLGDKSAALLLEDAPLERFLAELHDLSFSNNGQACSNNSRIIVPASRYDEIVDGIVEEVSSWRIGSSLDPESRIGPLVTEEHRAFVERHTDRAVREGARILTRGARPDRPGYFVAPTVLGEVTPEMTVFREEVFGPTVSVTRYSGDPEEGVRLVNDSAYGRAGAVFTEDESVGIDIARRIDTGAVGFNMYNFDIHAPFAVRKDSGIGFELGAEAIDVYLNYKTIFTPAVPAGF
ncbi:aldehyde dehydrogenase family protein [Leucobacter allii]|uniref:aldehyde dehydrogenase (NAD(+)) n=1 Tax=Leucobacter allii TaxID=2932247 RepID=A0ABY4FMZ5_9MICO|nr:aldehyde dehydrogenase family protein [Leucobacter allii]UOQ57648.1 aldehyde dehydrogenase family protein [Leucobacter allii]UOR02191.1 aldehyde dehydrogenase family protein [Leucobacter allii]